MKVNKIIISIILLCIVSLSIGFSAFETELSISNIVADVRIQKDIRITNIELISEQSNNIVPNYLNYDDDSLIADLTFNDISSYITYKITVTNIGNIDACIYNISSENSNIKYEITEGSFGTTINKLGGEYSIILKINPTITPESNTEVKLNLDFRPFHNVTYSNITVENTYPTSVIEGYTLTINFNDPPSFINVYANNIEIDRSNYSYNSSTGTLIYDNVVSNLVIERAESTLLEGKTFSATLKNFVNNSTDMVYNSQDSLVTYIGIYEDEIPEGYTDETFFNLQSISVSEKNRIKAYNDNGKVFIYSKDDILAPRDSYSLFRGYANLKELNITNLNTKNMTDPGAMFQDNTSLEYLDISTFDTSKVSRLFYTFTGNTSLKEVKLPAFNKRKLTNIQAVFKDCQSLERLDLSNWDTSQVTLMSSTFVNCYNLKSLNLTGWNTSNVTDMSFMFRYNKSLTELDISSFDTSKVTTMERMFGYCNNLENIYVGSGWTTENVTTSESMFSNTPNLPNFDSAVVDHTKAYVGEGGYLSYLPQ